jgi:hypothetical protein
VAFSADDRLSGPNAAADDAVAAAGRAIAGLIVGTAASPWSSAGPTVGRMIRLTREQMREASEAIDRFHQLANVARKTTDLEEHRRLWSEASEIQRQLQELLTGADDGT